MFLLNFYRPCEIILSYEAFEILVPGKGGGIPIMTHTGMFRPKGILSLSKWYTKRQGVGPRGEPSGIKRYGVPRPGPSVVHMLQADYFFIFFHS